MTSSPHILPDRGTTGAVRTAIEVRWTAVGPEPGRAGGRSRDRSFVLGLEPVDARHAIVECLVEQTSGVVTVMRRTPLPCTMTRDGRLLHVDVEVDGRRLLAMTCESGPRPGDDCRLLYAQCALLAEAGFPPGGFDPPTASLRRLESDAVAG